MVKIALLIGVSDYEPGLTCLPASVRDVEAMRQVLQDPQLGGFASSDVTVLKNPERLEIEEAIYTLFKERHRDDLVLLYFSGHGIMDYKQNRLYLTARKTRLTAAGTLIPPTAVSANFVHECMSLSRSRRVVILDSCFSGSFAEGLIPKDASREIDIGAHLGSKDWAVLTSSTSREYSFEQQGHNLSVYTHYLIEGIRTGEADEDEDGFVGIYELHKYASSKIRDQQLKMNPEIYTFREGFNIRLCRVPPIAPHIRYRRELKRILEQDESCRVTPRTLRLLRSRVEGLSVVAAVAVEDEVLAAHWSPLMERQQRYEQVVADLLQHGYPLSTAAKLELQQAQEFLYLRDEDVEALQSEKIQEWQTSQLTPPEVPLAVPPVQTENLPTQELSQAPVMAVPSIEAPIPPVDPVVSVPGYPPPRRPWLQLPSLSLQHQRWLLTGAGVVVFGGGTFVINNWLRFQSEQADHQRLVKLQALNTDGKYSDCITQTSAMSSEFRFAQEVQSLLNGCRLSQAQALAKANNLKDAISLVSQIPSSAGNYAGAQTVLTQWSDNLMQQATKQYQAGEINRARDLLKVIPSDSAGGKKAQQAINKWQKELAMNEKYLKDAQDALNRKEWGEAQKLAQKVTNSITPQQQKAKNIINQAEENMPNSGSATRDSPEPEPSQSFSNSEPVPQRSDDGVPAQQHTSPAPSQRPSAQDAPAPNQPSTNQVLPPPTPAPLQPSG